MNATEEMVLEVQKIIAKYQNKIHVEATKRGMARAKIKRLKEAREKLNNLLLEVEYDYIWHMLQHFIDTLDEKQLRDLIWSAQNSLIEDEPEVEDIFPPKSLEVKE